MNIHAPAASGCRLAYDFLEASVPFWWLPLIGFILAGLAYGLYRLFRTAAPMAVQRLASPSLGLAGALLAIFIFTIAMPVKGIWQYYDIREAIAKGRAITIAGIVTQYVPYKTRTESFAVCGKTFEIDPNGSMPGFGLVGMTGSPVRPGTYVQISYVDNTITRLELCDHPLAACR